MLDDNYAPLSHDHDALYYSKGETDTKLTGKSDTGHQHDDLYYQKSYLDGQFALKSDVGHAHDDLYYGKTYMDAALLGKSDAAHSHDDLYYQKSYIDTALSGKSDAAHNHDNLYYTETEVDTLLLGKVGVAQADSITSAMIANGAIKFEDIGQNQCAAGQVMKWSGTSGKWECANDDTRSQAEVENWAKGVCLDSEGELTALLNDNYAATSHSHGAADIASGTLDNERLSSSVSLLGQTIESGEISDGTIVNDDLAANAAISYGKLNLIGSLTNSDVSSSAGISYGKLNLSGSITDSDISSSANIPDTKLAVISTAGKVADSALSSNVSKFGSSVNLDSSETTGVLPVAKGGTGLSAAGSAGNLLRSTGAGWESWTPNYLTSEADGVVGNEVTNTTDATLTRSGLGTGASPYTLGLNLGNANTWTAVQTFNPSSGSVPFAVGADKNSVVTNLNADMLDGMHGSDLQKKYTRTVVVSPVGTTAQNGTALLNALAGITDASASNPYLLKIEPGVYSLGTGTLVMKEYVDIEGSGETVTKITALGKTSSTYGTVNFKNNSELRQLTVENTGGNSNAIAINVKSTTARISHVTAIASGGSSNTYGILVDSSSNAVLSHITASASGQASIVAGIALKYSTVSIIDAASTATATSTSTSWCYGVTFFASQGYASDIRASASGTYVSRLAGIYNYSIDSLTMNDITASVDASNDDNYGIYNENVSNVMMNVVIVVSNATMANYGLFNNSTSKPVINNLVVKVSGSSAIINYGIVFDTGSYPIINSSKITVSGATGASYGIASWGFNPRVNIADITVSGGAAQNFGIYSGGGSIFVNTARISVYGASTNNYGVHNTSANFPVFRDVSISVSDGEYAYGVYNTVLSDIYYASFTNVYIDATQGSVMSYGMRNMDANVRVTNSTFDATSPYPGIGVSSTQSSGGPYTVTIDNSQIISNSSNATVENKNSCITRIGATKLEGGAATNSGGTLTCAGVHDENYAFYSSTCP